MRKKIIDKTVMAVFAASVIASILLNPSSSRADNFQNVAYDPVTDELVIEVLYRGTNPEH